MSLKVKFSRYTVKALKQNTMYLASNQSVISQPLASVRTAQISRKEVLSSFVSFSMTVYAVEKSLEMDRDWVRALNLNLAREGRVDFFHYPGGGEVLRHLSGQG